jgi:hypothetical protein
MDASVIRYRIRYGIRCRIQSAYLGLVAILYPTLVVQMLLAGSLHLCFHLLIVSIRISYICSIQLGVGACANCALPCVTHGRRRYLRAVQYKHVIKGSAQTNTIVCKSEIHIH